MYGAIFRFEIDAVPTLLKSAHEHSESHIFHSSASLNSLVMSKWTKYFPLLFPVTQWLQLSSYFSWRRATVSVFVCFAASIWFVRHWIFVKSCLLLLEDCNYPCVGKEYVLRMEIWKNSANKEKNIIWHHLEMWN